MPIAMPVVWLVAVVIFVIAEAATLGLTSIWFACGALAAMIAALLGVGIWWQLTLFVAGSAVLLATTRKWVSRLKLKKDPTNADRIVGQKGIVIQEINNQLGKGQVRVGGQVWTARSTDEEPVAQGSEVEVVRISGVKAIVRPGADRGGRQQEKENKTSV